MLQLTSQKSNFNNQYKRYGTSQPSFTNRSAGNYFVGKITKGLQACDKNAMVGIAVIDLLSMIIPRTIIDATRNGFAATETFVRESSGLIVNCMVPGLVVMGAGHVLKNRFKDDFSKLPLHKVWSDKTSTIKLREKWTKAYKHAEANNITEPKAIIKDYLTKVIDEVDGLNGKKTVQFAKELEGIKISNIAKDSSEWKKLEKIFSEKELKDLSAKNTNLKQAFIDTLSDDIANLDKKIGSNKKVGAITEFIGEKLGASKNIGFRNEKGLSSTLSELLRDSVDMGKLFNDPKITSCNIDKFTNKFSKLIKHKSFIGLGVIAGVGFGIQAVNRYITKKRTGVDGFVGYKDFSKGGKKEKTKEEKQALTFKKILASIGMMGMAAVTMGKTFVNGKFNTAPYQFKGIFPSMGQARVISATTYTGRLVASEDKNELRESFIRDSLGFLNLYVLGDYVSKGIASIMDKGKGELLNYKNFNEAEYKKMPAFKKAVYWIKNVELKAFEEISDKRLKNKRAISQASGLAYAMLMLGIFVPIYNKRMTERREQKQQKLGAQNESKISSTKAQPSMTSSKAITPETKKLFSSFLAN